MRSFVQVPRLSTLMLLVLLITEANLIWALVYFTFSSGRLYFPAVSLGTYILRGLVPPLINLFIPMEHLAHLYCCSLFIGMFPHLVMYFAI